MDDDVPTLNHTRARGQNAEQLVADYLIRHGYTLIDQNVQVGRLEIDLIMRKGRTLVICEVRSRNNDFYGSPVESITATKIQNIRRAAVQWLQKHPYPGCLVRFDAAGVILRLGQDPIIQYYENAF